MRLVTLLTLRPQALCTNKWEALLLVTRRTMISRGPSGSGKQGFPYLCALSDDLLQQETWEFCTNAGHKKHCQHWLSLKATQHIIFFLSDNTMIKSQSIIILRPQTEDSHAKISVHVGQQLPSPEMVLLKFSSLLHRDWILVQANHME